LSPAFKFPLLRCLHLTKLRKLIETQKVAERRLNNLLDAFERLGGLRKALEKAVGKKQQETIKKAIDQLINAPKGTKATSKRCVKNALMC
jgi:hypothetical protein